MSGDSAVSPPPVMWAQRSGIVFLSICLEDVRDPVIKINPTSIYFRGTGGTEKKEHEVTIELYDEIIPEQSRQAQTGRIIELILKKKEEGPYWPYLTKTKQRYHWLKINFNKWKEEDDSAGSDAEEKGIEDMISSIGGGGGEENLEDMIRTMGDLGTKNPYSSMPGEDSDEESEDSEQLPDLDG